MAEVEMPTEEEEPSLDEGDLVQVTGGTNSWPPIPTNNTDYDDDAD